MEILDLRRVRSSQLRQLFEEQERIWFHQLHWDYRPSAQLISQFIDARALGGYAALDGGHGIGYSFFVSEEHKGLIGDLFVSSVCSGQGVEGSLASHVIQTLRALPQLKRIEAQLIPFGPDSLASCFREENFEVHPRLFMHVPLAQARLAAAGNSPLALQCWDDRFFEPAAALILHSYAGHVDSRINDQYQSLDGAMKFLKNIIIFPGCGLFQPDTSYVATDGRRQLAGMVLGSMVAPGVGHITQICVLPGYQGHGLGAHLLAASLEAFRRKRYDAVSLTVTASNIGAVRLYERFGFATVKRFDAFLWDAGSGIATSERAREEGPSARS